MFIDPASRSSGWSLFNGGSLVKSGTISISNDDPYRRLADIYDAYLALGFFLSQTGLRPGAVHVEQLPRSCHIYTHYSVGIIGAALCQTGAQVKGDVPIKAWQKHANWKARLKDWAKEGYKSEDEFAAVCMGKYWLAERVA